MNVNLFNNSSPIATTIWLFRSDFYFLKPLHIFGEVIPSAHTDQKSLPLTRSACICFCSDLLLFQGQNISRAEFSHLFGWC